MFSNVINAGIYVLEPEVLSHIPADGQCDFSMDLFPAIMKNLFLGGYLLPGYWNDIGRPSNYLQANGDALVGRFPLAKYLGDLEPFRGGSPIVGKRSSIGDVDISCPVLLGENCRIEEGSALRSFVVLGDDVTIGKDCVLEGVVVHNGTRIDASADLRKCIIGRGCEIGPDVELAEGTVIGDGTRIGESCRIGANMKIWAGSTLGPHTMIVPD